MLFIGKSYHNEHCDKKSYGKYIDCFCSLSNDWDGFNETFGDTPVS